MNKFSLDNSDNIKEKNKVVYIVNNIAFFVSHRMPIAIKLIAKGHEVSLITGNAGSQIMENKAKEILSNHNIKYYKVSLSTSLKKLPLDIIGLIEIILLLNRIRPDVVHTASPKANIFGGIAAKFVKIRLIVFSISGMGYVYTEDKKIHIRMIRILLTFIFKWIFNNKNKKIIVQNTFDENFINKKFDVDIKDIVKFPGSGVDLNLFKNHHHLNKKNIILFPARIIREKGIYEFVYTAMKLKPKYTDWQFIIAGTIDYDTPSSISKKKMKEWQESQCIEWIGYDDNIINLFKDSSIVCLPSYREGMPKSLLEAAASGCAVVTSDIAGCREAIIENKTGELVQVKDKKKLLLSIEKLIKNVKLRQKYGENGIILAKEKFNLDIIVNNIISIYKLYE